MLLHYTGDQINEGIPVFSYADISPGDLVLVPGNDGTVANPGHVGIYIGDGLVESAVDVQYGVIVQPYSYFVSGGLSGIRDVG
jgi:cell wall-associated NlpC family hydrolase